MAINDIDKERLEQNYTFIPEQNIEEKIIYKMEYLNKNTERLIKVIEKLCLILENNNKTLY